LNGETIPFAAGMTGRSITICNNKIVIDGQVYRAGRWEKATNTGGAHPYQEEQKDGKTQHRRNREKDENLY
jgi:hypothetical protein